jgi:hypothetical protein
MKTDTDTYFRTSHLNLAIFLFASDQQIAGINLVGEGRKEFAFIRTDYLEELEWLYKYGEREDERLFIEVHKYENARRELLDRLLN